VWAGAATGLISGALVGSVNNNLMHGADWFPTLCTVTGCNCAPLPFDGVDQFAALFNVRVVHAGAAAFGLIMISVEWVGRFLVMFWPGNLAANVCEARPGSPNHFVLGFTHDYRVAYPYVRCPWQNGTAPRTEILYGQVCWERWPAHSHTSHRCKQ